MVGVSRCVRSLVIVSVHKILLFMDGAWKDREGITSGLVRMKRGNGAHLQHASKKKGWTKTGAELPVLVGVILGSKRVFTAMVERTPLSRIQAPRVCVYVVVVACVVRPFKREGVDVCWIHTQPLWRRVRQLEACNWMSASQAMEEFDQIKWLLFIAGEMQYNNADG